jgi:hypothetical protein
LAKYPRSCNFGLPTSFSSTVVISTWYAREGELSAVWRSLGNKCLANAVSTSVSGSWILGFLSKNRRTLGNCDDSSFLNLHKGISTVISLENHLCQSHIGLMFQTLHDFRVEDQQRIKDKIKKWLSFVIGRLLQNLRTYDSRVVRWVAVELECFMSLAREIFSP